MRAVAPYEPFATRAGVDFLAELASVVGEARGLLQKQPHVLLEPDQCVALAEIEAGCARDADEFLQRTLAEMLSSWAGKWIEEPVGTRALCAAHLVTTRYDATLRIPSGAVEWHARACSPDYTKKFQSVHPPLALAVCQELWQGESFLHEELIDTDQIDEYFAILKDLVSRLHAIVSAESKESLSRLISHALSLRDLATVFDHATGSSLVVAPVAGGVVLSYQSAGGLPPYSTSGADDSGDPVTVLLAGASSEFTTGNIVDTALARLAICEFLADGMLPASISWHEV